MDIEKLLADLRAERDLIEQTIVNLEILARKGKRGRGRPPGSVTRIKQIEKVGSASAQ